MYYKLRTIFGSNLTIVLILILFVKTENSDPECCFNSSFATRDNQYVTLSGFNQLAQLKFNCNTFTPIAIWEIHPSTQIILNDSLSLTNMSSITPTGQLFSIWLANFLGLDISSNPFKHIQLLNYDKQFIWWTMDSMKFDFYLNNRLLDEEDCNSDLPAKSLISSARILDLRKKIKFSSPICLYLFKNVYILLFSISRISSSLIEMNVLNFQQKNVKKLNSTIFHVQLVFYHASLNEKLLNARLFKSLEILDINGPLFSIQNNLFKSFKRLRMIRMRSQNVEKFLIHNNKWLNSLNTYTNVNLSNPDEINRNLRFSLILVFYQAFSNVSFYDFPDHDFCQLSQFPHQRLVIIALYYISELNIF
jgi:hypothetical protein